MNEKDIELILLTKHPIYVGNVPIYPISISDIARVGYTKYNSEFRLLCLSEEDIKTIFGDDASDCGVFLYLVRSAIQSNELMDLFIYWLSVVTHSEIQFNRSSLAFVGDGFEISSGNFDEIQDVIRIRNGLKDIAEEEDNPDNEAARRVLQRRKEERQKRKKAKMKGDESDITLSDLVSILSAGFNMKIDDVIEYDLYQFNDQFNRLKIMDNYDVSVQALLHGAKKEDINFTHWITKIKHDPE